VGLPIILQTGVKISSAKAVLTENGKEVPSCLVQRKGFKADRAWISVAQALLYDAVFVIPGTPLKKGKTYKLSITHNGSKKVAWSFKAK
jgi:hypothetical protein